MSNWQAAQAARGLDRAVPARVSSLLMLCCIVQVKGMNQGQRGTLVMVPLMKRGQQSLPLARHGDEQGMLGVVKSVSKVA